LSGSRFNTLSHCFYLISILTNYLQTEESVVDFVAFFATTYKETYKPLALLRFITIDMPKDEINILGSKAVIFQNDFGVWQFRLWLADEDKYFRQSLRTKNKEDAIHKAEDMYAELRCLKKQGKKIYSINIKKGVEMYLTDKKQ
jgi:hypothetical protein